MDFLRILESVRTPMLDGFFQIITLLGQEELILGILCMIFWCLNKRLAYQLAFTFFSSGLIVQTLKITFRVPRPWVIDPAFQAVESAVPAATGYSFPSGHTQGGTSLYASLMSHTRKKAVKFLCVLAFLSIGFSRMYLGVHTPKDVLVSMIISLFFSWVMYKFMEKYEENHSRDLLISILLAVAAGAVLIYAFLLLNKGLIDQKYASDCCKAAGAGFGFAAGWYLERTKIQFSHKTRTAAGQIIKFLIGAGVLLVLKSALKFILGTSIAADAVRYFLLVIWIVVLYPVMIKYNPLRNS